MSKALSGVELTVTTVGLAIFGWLCMSRPHVLLKWSQQNYANSKLIQAWPFSNLIFKSWYPTYLRIAGAIFWLCALGGLYLLYLLVTNGLRN
jgi:hypothetical protein